MVESKCYIRKSIVNQMKAGRVKTQQPQARFADHVHSRQQEGWQDTGEQK